MHVIWTFFPKPIIYELIQLSCPNLFECTCVSILSVLWNNWYKYDTVLWLSAELISSRVACLYIFSKSGTCFLTKFLICKYLKECDIGKLHFAAAQMRQSDHVHIGHWSTTVVKLKVFQCFSVLLITKLMLSISLFTLVGLLRRARITADSHAGQEHKPPSGPFFHLERTFWWIFLKNVIKSYG